MKLRPFLLSSLLSLCGLFAPLPARGQTTFTTPQTVDATLATATLCTGSAQTFVTGGPNKQFQNLGQTQHYITVTSSTATTLSAEIDGLDPSGNVFRISDQIIGQTSIGSPLTVGGSGRFVQIQVSITCSPNTATFTLQYSGTSATSNLNAGSYFLAQIDKNAFVGIPAGTNNNAGWQTPYGNTSGTLYANYVGGAGPAGSTVAVKCNTVEGTGVITVGTFTLAAPAGVQRFDVNAQPCVSTTLVYTSGGASANSLDLEYVYTYPGEPTPGATIGANVNVAQWGGAATSLGQKTMANSVPVVIASDQSAVPVSGTITGGALGVIQPATFNNSESTSAVNTAVTKSIAAVAAKSVYLYGVTVRCSAGNASVTVKDGVGGTVIWSSDANFAGVSAASIAWTSSPLASTSGNGMDIVLGTCGGGNTGTLDVQASQL